MQLETWNSASQGFAAPSLPMSRTRIRLTLNTLSHWLGLTVPLGAYDLSQFLFLLREAAASAKRESFTTRIAWCMPLVGVGGFMIGWDSAGMTAKVTIIAKQG